MSRRASSVYQFFHYKEELRTAKISTLVVLVAFVCWTPFFALLFLNAAKAFGAFDAGAAVHFWLHLTSGLLTLAFAAFSPYVYVFRSEKVQTCLRQMFYQFRDNSCLFSCCEGREKLRGSGKMDSGRKWRKSGCCPCFRPNAVEAADAGGEEVTSGCINFHFNLRSRCKLVRNRSFSCPALQTPGARFPTRGRRTTRNAAAGAASRDGENGLNAIKSPMSANAAMMVITVDEPTKESNSNSMSANASASDLRGRRVDHLLPPKMALKPAVSSPLPTTTMSAASDAGGRSSSSNEEENDLSRSSIKEEDESEFDEEVFAPLKVEVRVEPKPAHVTSNNNSVNENESSGPEKCKKSSLEGARTLSFPRRIVKEFVGTVGRKNWKNAGSNSSGSNNNSNSLSNSNKGRDSSPTKSHSNGVPSIMTV